MKDTTPRYQRLFAELKRRSVFRVMAVYGIVGFVVLQVVDLVVPALLLPDWTYRLVAVLLLTGFPVAVVLAWAFEQGPGGLRRTERATPSEIAAIVAAPAHKRWPAVLLALAGVGLLLGGWWVGRRSVPGVSPAGASGTPPVELRLALAEAGRAALPSLAVLPFVDMSPAGDQEYFSDGITEELLNALAKIRELKVLGRTSAFAYKGENKDLRAIGTELGAAYIVEGSVRKSGENLRITAQLIDSGDGTHLWSEQYDRPMGEVFAIQTEIAEAIAASLRVPLGLEEDGRLVSPTEDLEAYDLYLAGRARMRERGESVLEAIELFEGAIARDSNWAPAWAGLAESHALVPYYTVAMPVDSALWENSLGAAEHAARRALELDPNNASALVAIGNVHRDRREWEAAEDAYTRALTLDPENVEALQQYAEHFSYVGRVDEAYRLARRALSLDRSPIRLNIAGLMARYNGRYEEATALLAEGIRADPAGRVTPLRNNQQAVALETGHWAAYRELIRERLSVLMADERRPEAARADARERLEELERTWPADQPVTPEVAAWITDRWSRASGAILYLALGEERHALEAVEYHRDHPLSAENARYLFTPGLDSLRDEPRFEAVLAANGLAGLRPQRLPAEPDPASRSATTSQ